MTRLSLALYLFALASAVLAGGIPVARADADLGAAMEAEFAALNAEREAAGLPALSRTPAVQDVATTRAATLAASGVLSHTAPAGQDVVSLLQAHGIWCTRFGENVGQSDVAVAELVPTLHTAWMHSPAHRANILDPTFHQVGLGVAQAGDTVFAAIIFLD